MCMTLYHRAGSTSSAMRQPRQRWARARRALLTCAVLLATGMLPLLARAGDAPSEPPYRLEDDFQRADAATLGGAWVDCHATHPGSFEPLGIHEGGVVVADPFSRPGEYDSTPPSGHPPKDGKMYPGIGCAYVDTGTETVAVKVSGSGNLGLDRAPPISHVEGTPLLYVTPGNSRFGFGAWISELYGVPVIFAGYIGNPVEKFEVVAHARIRDGKPTGTPRELELRALEPGKVTVWIDGKQVAFDGGIGLQPIAVDPQLVGSTRHGFAVDAHYVDPPQSIKNIKSIEAITIEEVD